jgi:hypothetical protein
MIAILGTSGVQMFDPTAGVNYTTYPMRNRFDSIYFVAARALWDVPDNLVEAPLRQIARERSYTKNQSCRSTDCLSAGRAGGNHRRARPDADKASGVNGSCGPR